MILWEEATDSKEENHTEQLPAPIFIDLSIRNLIRGQTIRDLNISDFGNALFSCINLTDE